MVRLLRDGLGISLDDFAGGRASGKLTLYDTNPRYRSLIAEIESLPRRDRERLLEFIGWIISGRREEGATALAPRELQTDEELNIGGPGGTR